MAGRPYSGQFASYSRDDIIAAVKAGKGSLASFCYAILNQGSEPLCWTEGPTQALMVMANILYGDQAILDPSPIPVICRNYGGGAITDAIETVQSVYGQPDAQYMGVDPRQAQWQFNLRSGWQAEAKKRIIPPGLWTNNQSVLDFASGIINGHPVCYGSTLPYGGHCMCALEVSLDSDGHSFVFAGPQSWGADWANDTGSYPGRPGWWQIRESVLNRGGAFSPDGLGSYSLIGLTDMAIAPPGDSPHVRMRGMATVYKHGHEYRVMRMAA
jgi:hypothetical protein